MYRYSIILAINCILHSFLRAGTTQTPRSSTRKLSPQQIIASKPQMSIVLDHQAYADSVRETLLRLSISDTSHMAATAPTPLPLRILIRKLQEHNFPSKPLPNEIYLLIGKFMNMDIALYHKKIFMPPQKAALSRKRKQRKRKNLCCTYTTSLALYTCVPATIIYLCHIL